MYCRSIDLRVTLTWTGHSGVLTVGTVVYGGKRQLRALQNMGLCTRTFDIVQVDWPHPWTELAFPLSKCSCIKKESQQYESCYQNNSFGQQTIYNVASYSVLASYYHLSCTIIIIVLYVYHSPSLGSPSCLHTTAAALSSHESSQTVPQMLLKHTSTRP